MIHRVALLRGINVGRARRIAMADLRGLAEELGFVEPRTLLASGNLLFRTGRRSASEIRSALETAIRDRFGFAIPVVMLSARELKTIVRENPLARTADDPARLLVCFVNRAAELGKARALLKLDWGEEAFAMGRRAAYLWCAPGVLESKVAKAFSRATGDAATLRNWATVLKLIELVETIDRGLDDV